MVSELPVEPVAVVAWAFLFVFAATRLPANLGRPVDLFANLLLLLACGALGLYSYRRASRSAAPATAPPSAAAQPAPPATRTDTRLLQIGYAGLVGFFLLTLTQLSAAMFRFYDAFGLFGAMFMLFAASTGIPRTAGYLLLALYFLFGAYQKTTVQGAEILQLIGRSMLLLVYGYWAVSNIYHGRW